MSEMMIDVGPMQINWYWQYPVMGSPWRITDPAVNIKTAAQILKTHYNRCGDWWRPWVVITGLPRTRKDRRSPTTTGNAFVTFR